MKDIKRQMPTFAFYDRSAIQTHLEKMAAAGWMVEAPGSLIWRYRRIEPKKLHFSVTYFPTASGFDPALTDGQRRMAEYCARDGWTLAAQWGQMQIFCHDRAEAPTPIETDAVTQVENVHQAMRRSMIPAHLIMLVLCLYQIGFMVQQCITDPVRFLSTASSLYLFPMWLFILLPILYDLCFYFYWHHKAKLRAENGEFFEIRVKPAASWILLAAPTLTLLFAFGGSTTGRFSALIGLVSVLLTIWIVRSVTGWLKKRGTRRSVNRALSMVVCAGLSVALLSGMIAVTLRYGLPDDHTPVGTYKKYNLERKVYADSLPLRIEDLTAVANSAWSLEAQKDETVLLSVTRYKQWPLTQDKDVPGLEYTVTEIKAAFLYDLCKNGLLRDNNKIVDGVVVLRDEYLPVDAAPWGADAAYQLYFSGGRLDRYLLCYGNRIVEITFDWEPIPEQMAVVAEKFGAQ